MFTWIAGLFARERKLEDIINQTKFVRISGIRFKIRKIQVLDHLNGSDVINKTYDNYQVGKAPPSPVNVKKLKEYYGQVLVAGVVSPPLSHKAGEEGKTHVEDLLANWDIVEDLYTEIIDFTYGKKKVLKSFSSHPSVQNISI